MNVSMREQRGDDERLARDIRAIALHNCRVKKTRAPQYYSILLYIHTELTTAPPLISYSRLYNTYIYEVYTNEFVYDGVCSLCYAR